MIFHSLTNVNKRTMKKIQYQCPHLGAYIAEVQYAVPVDGHLLSEAALARRALYAYYSGFPWGLQSVKYMSA